MINSLNSVSLYLSEEGVGQRLFFGLLFSAVGHCTDYTRAALEALASLRGCQGLQAEQLLALDVDKGTQLVHMGGNGLALRGEGGKVRRAGGWRAGERLGASGW